MDTRTTLIMAVTTYDRKESAKRSYNRFALGQYIRAVDNAMLAVKDDGYTLRDALVESFTGRLLDVVLKAVKLDKASSGEQVNRPIAISYRS